MAAPTSIWSASPPAAIMPRPTSRRCSPTRGGPSSIISGRFDIAAVQHYLGIVAAPAWDTKIASRLVRTYTDRHGLKELVRELLATEVSKAQQSSDWGSPQLTDAQKDYAASDVRYLHRLKDELERRLVREGRMELAQACFDFLPTRAALDLAGWPEIDIFAHV